MKKVGLADWRTSNGLPSASDPETEADRTPRESSLACMTANREPRLIKALKLTGRRRFALRAVASCRYAGEREPRTRGTSLAGQFLFGKSFRPMSALVVSGHFGTSDRCPLYPRKRTLLRVIGMSALCQKQTHAPQQNIVSIRSPRRHGRAATAAQQARALWRS
jgi:hypothetical protein